MDLGPLAQAPRTRVRAGLLGPAIACRRSLYQLVSLSASPLKGREVRPGVPISSSWSDDPHRIIVDLELISFGWRGWRSRPYRWSGLFLSGVRTWGLRSGSCEGKSALSCARFARVSNSNLVLLNNLGFIALPWYRMIESKESVSDNIVFSEHTELIVSIWYHMFRRGRRGFLGFVNARRGVAERDSSVSIATSTYRDTKTVSG